MNDKTERINISLPLPSVSFKHYIEKLIRDDDFFTRALESPLRTLEECGVNMEQSEFSVNDFATFFCALSGLKEVLKSKDKKDLTFEKIFGQPAQIIGSMIDAQVSQGFCKEWDNKTAFTQKTSSFSSSQNFSRGSDICGSGPASISNVKNVEVMQGRMANIYREGPSQTFESSETWNHTRYEWSTNEFQQSNTKSEAGVSKNFETDGRGTMLDYMNGPLIHPADFSAIAARLDTFTQIVSGKIKGK